MKKRKRVLLAGLSAIVMIAAGAAFAACGGKNIVYSFVTYDDQTITVSGKKGEEVVFPEVARDGYVFEGWYLDEGYNGSPVTSATFESGVTYYAKWAQVYAITLDLDGGQLEQSVLYLKEGENVYSFMQSYVPVKGEYEFGGWYLGDEPLSSDAKMTTAGIALTAKYKAAYTVDVYLQNEDLETYTFHQAYETGFALIDEEYAPQLSVAGYVQSADDETSLIISADKTQNVYTFHFDRKDCVLTLIANYPDGSDEIRTETHVYGSAFALPENIFSVEGYRFFGWARSRSAGFDAVITDDPYTVSGDTVLYAVWNKGYVDMFSGEDYIYLSHDEENTAVLCRGGVDIPGTYNVKKKWYEFASETTSYVLNARINDNGTFVYYANRKGTYYLFENSSINSQIVLELDDMNGIEYYSTEENNKQYKEGTYSIDESGLYVAEFDDGTTFTFLLGTSGNTDVFRIRGAEYEYGVLAYRSAYYPVVMLDGFGYALYSENSSSSSYYYYSIEGDVVVLTSAAGSSTSIRIIDYDGVYGYDLYTSDLDRVFYGEGDATLTLDGCATAVYEKGATKEVGSYTLVSSVFGGYLVTVTSETSVKLYYIYGVQTGNIAVYSFEEKAGYREYLYVSDDGKLSGTPYLVDNGDGTASLYEKDSGGKLSEVSSGTLIKQGYSYLYTVDENGVADWASAQATALVLNLDTESTSYSVYYWISAVDEEGATDYSETYTREDGSSLTLVSCFAIYIDESGNVFSGIYSDYTSYIRVSGGGAYAYFSLTKDGNNDFEVLANEPLILRMRRGGSTVSSVTLTVSGRELSEGRYEAVYTEANGDEKVVYAGYYTAEQVSALNFSSYVYTFCSVDGAKSFKFAVSTSGSYYYFNYYELDEVITFVSYTAISDSDTEDATLKLTLTDEKTEDGYVLLFTRGEETIRGSFTSRTVYAFSEYAATVYTFTAAEGGESFEFTLINAYFRVCAEAATYTAADGSELTLDGATHIARYLDSQSQYHDGYYLVTTNILDEGELAIYMLIDDAEFYFDLKESDHTFELRGSEAAVYLKIKNGTPDGELVTLDGHGNATLQSLAGEEELSAVYTLENGVCTITFVNGVYVGVLGSYAYSGSTYNAFILTMTEPAGAYLNRDDLSVLVLDGAGNAVKYNSVGEKDTGTYVVLTDTLLYYANDEKTDAALYTYSGDGTVTAASYSATYYADDFASVVFYINGVVLFNNGNAAYYSYDEAEGRIFIYTYSDSESANEYGYITEELIFDGDTITYTDVDTGRQRTYTYFDGTYVTFTDESGNTLEFQPTGEATFTVTGTYTSAESGQTQTYYVVVGYGDNGETDVYLAAYGSAYLAGSTKAYRFTVNYDLTLHLDSRTFVFTDSEYIYGLSAYDYLYLSFLSTYGSAYASLFNGYFGYLSVIGSVQDGEVTYSVAGVFNYIAGTDGKALTFTDGTLSTAGYYNQYYGNLYTSEFTGSDGETYHLNFYLVSDAATGFYTYIIHSCTLVTDRIGLGDDTVIYSEKLIYTTGFKFVKSTDEITGEQEYYQVGDDFYPSLKYKGETICRYNWADLGDNEWVFASREYAVRTYTDYYYYFDYTVDEDGNIVNGTIVKRSTIGYETADGDYVYVLYDIEDGNMVEVFALVMDGDTIEVTDCVKNEDGSFAVTTEAAKYTVTFTVTTGEDGEAVTTVTVTEVTVTDADGETDVE